MTLKRIALTAIWLGFGLLTFALVGGLVMAFLSSPRDFLTFCVGSGLILVMVSGVTLLVITESEDYYRTIKK